MEQRFAAHRRVGGVEATFEDEVSAILDLADGAEAREVQLFALGSCELWSQDELFMTSLCLLGLAGLLGHE